MPEPPPELENFEPIIEAARAGDVGEAAHLLFMAAVYLENEWPLPDPLRLYLIDAFRKITKTTPSDIPISTAISKFSELKAFVGQIQETRDANIALNLKRRPGQKRTAVAAFLQNGMIATEVKLELDKGKKVTKAVAAAAEKLGIENQTVWVAWRLMKRTFDKR